VNAHEVKPVRLIQSLCAMCGSSLAAVTLLYIVLPCVAAVVSCPAWRMLVLLIARYVSNFINEHYYYYYYYYYFLVSCLSNVERFTAYGESIFTYDYMIFTNIFQTQVYL